MIQKLPTLVLKACDQSPGSMCWRHGLDRILLVQRSRLGESSVRELDTKVRKSSARADQNVWGTLSLFKALPLRSICALFCRLARTSMYFGVIRGPACH